MMSVSVRMVAFIGVMSAALLTLSGGCSDVATRVPESMTIAGASAAAGTTGGGIATPRAGTGSFAGTGVAGPLGAAGRAPGPAGTGAVAGMRAGTAGVTGSTAGMPAVGGMGAAGMAMSGAGAAPPPPPTGEGPVLPEIKGECPQFMNGSTIMAAGHRSVLILSGEPGKGGALLFYWHGTGGSASEAMRTLPAAVRTEIISGGGIIASFNGSQSSGTGGDCSGTAAHNQADFNAADLIAACAVKNHGIDPRRIYTTGCSAGGLQSGCMSQMRSSYIAAAAPNSGGVVFPQAWQDKHSPAIFTMHGGTGDVVIVTFSQTSATLDMNAKTHGSFVVNCNHGGSHCGAPAALQTAAWTFMKDHPWGFTKSPWETAIPAGVPDYCKIF